ncbi:MAG: hypothetical protein JWM10_4023 [Myxococcaceae bacterium]|nr:hypothetical protein [Myxococcaceae bacterium]
MRNPSLNRYLPLAVALAACADRDPRYARSMESLAPVAAGSALVYVQPALARATVVDLTQETPTVRQVAVGADPVVVSARVAHDEALVLSRGERGSQGVAPAPATLSAITANGAARRWTLGSPFNAVAQDAAGRYAITYYNNSASAGRLLFNPNEVAVVDLDRPSGAANPVIRTVRSFGGVPNGVVFSPTMTVAGEPRTLAVVLSDAYVTLLDLNHPERSEVTVRLTLPEDARAVAPAQVVFDTDNATMYLRADQSNDLYVLRLVTVTPENATANDFRPALNQLAAGVRPADLALFGEANARKLLVVSPGSRDARVIDTVANTTTVVPLDAVANRVLLFNGPSPRSPAPALRALLYATAGVASAVSFVELTDIESRRSQNVETLQLGRITNQALALPERGVVMFGHPTSAMGSLSLLDLGRRTAAPIFSEAALENARFDDDRQALWVAPQSGQRLGFIELTNFRPGEIRLDAPIVDVIPVARGMARRVVALHDAPDGWITVVDGTDVTRERSRSLRGFLLTGLLDEGEAQ